MKGKFFIDTNIFVYSFDNTDERKQSISRRLISDALEKHTGIISCQVVQEFLNIALNKFKNKIKPEDAKEYLTAVLASLCEIFPGMNFYLKSLEIKAATGFSFYDSLIVAAAIQGNCTILYTEDLQHNRNIGDLKIINPFL